MPSQSQPLSVRFWNNVAIGPFTECWLWQGKPSKMGYGRIAVDPTGKLAYAHRVSWELHFGLIPKGMFVCHHCDTPLCVNPYHLFLGSQADNLADMRNKDRHYQDYHQKGQDNPAAKLSESDVLAIRALHARGIGCRRLARQFGVEKGTIQSILRGKTWQHVR